ncbi:MAG: hypothetical protein KGR69_02195 [Verrucomicrobia bacterium]|nr:hypothetical protein [Verrucomicrobiota bacterium]
MHSRTGPFSLVTDTAVSRTLVLLIEDEPAIAETVVYALEAAGFDAPKAGGGAVARLRFAPDR